MCLFKSLRFSSVWFHHFSKYFYIVLSSAGQPGESFHFFNLSSFGRDERMIKAQFRWFRKKRKFYPGSFHTPHFYKVNASCLLAFKDKSFSLFSYIVQETLWQYFGALTTKCTRPVSLSAAFDNRGPLTGILTFLKTNSDSFCLFVGGGVFSSLFFLQVALYEVLENLVKPWRGNLITSRLVPLYTQGWEVFNVTQIVKKKKNP